MLWVPPGVGKRLSFLTPMISSQLQLLVDDQMVLDIGKGSGAIDLHADGIWVKVAILYRYSGNMMDAAVPQFKVQF